MASNFERAAPKGRHAALEDPIVRFVVAPSLHADYELRRSGIFFGTDRERF